MNQAILGLAVVLFTSVVYGQNRTASVPEPSSGTGLRRWEAGFDAQEFHKGGTPESSCLPSGCNYVQFAAGVHASLNINQHLAIDSSAKITPTSSPYDAGGNNFVEGGRATELLLGARGSVRTRHWGFFADAEPGLLSWSHVVLGNAFDEPPIVGRRNSFVIDMGGGVEYAPQPRMRVRLGLGDLLVRSNDTFTLTGPPSAGSHVFTSYAWQDELRANADVSWGFGKPILWTPSDMHQPPGHRFFDEANISVIAISLLGQTSDAITTQRFLHHGYSEEDPLARPFVDQGWAGQIALGVVGNGLQLSLMYALHRMHKHWLERTVPLLVGAEGAISAYRNDSLLANHRQ